MEQLPGERKRVVARVLQFEECDLHDSGEGNRGVGNSTSPRVYTSEGSDDVFSSEEMSSSSSSGESQGEWITEQNLLFKGTGFLRNGLIAKGRWRSLKRRMERNTPSGRVRRLEFPEIKLSKNLGDDVREAHF